MRHLLSSYNSNSIKWPITQHVTFCLWLSNWNLRSIIRNESFILKIPWCTTDTWFACSMHISMRLNTCGMTLWWLRDIWSVYVKYLWKIFLSLFAWTQKELQLLENPLGSLVVTGEKWTWTNVKCILWKHMKSWWNLYFYISVCTKRHFFADENFLS